MEFVSQTQLNNFIKEARAQRIETLYPGFCLPISEYQKIPPVLILKGFFRCLLYHTKDCQGATTAASSKILFLMIIPYQGLPGGYNTPKSTPLKSANYTIPRINRGLQRRRAGISPPQDYTIPRINRGLQRLQRLQQPENQKDSKR